MHIEIHKLYQIYQNKNNYFQFLLLVQFVVSLFELLHCDSYLVIIDNVHSIIYTDPWIHFLSNSQNI